MREWALGICGSLRLYTSSCAVTRVPRLTYASELLQLCCQRVGVHFLAELFLCALTSESSSFPLWLNCASVSVALQPAQCP